MKPPICALCRKRFDPNPSSEPGRDRRGGLVRFADHRPLPDGMTGHPEGTAWFCRHHVRAAQSLQDRPLAEAFGALGWGRRWARLRGVAIVISALLAAVTGWNVAGAVNLEEIDTRYVARIVDGRFDGEVTDREGALLAARWVETKTRPVWDPFRILWHHLWYSAWTEDYELVVWIEPEPMDLSLREFAIYQSERTVFLRIEFEGRNRVLHASFTAEELEQALGPFLAGAERQLTPEAFP